MDLHFEEQALGIHQQMPFAPFDLLAPIIPALLADAGSFDALTIDDADTRLGLAPQGDARLPTRGGVEVLPPTLPAPLP